MLSPEQGPIAADVEDMTLADDGTEISVPNKTGGTAPAVAVLQTINGNTGARCTPDPHSRFPPTSRGARSSPLIPSVLTKLWSGRARR